MPGAAWPVLPGELPGQHGKRHGETARGKDTRAVGIECRGQRLGRHLICDERDGLVLPDRRVPARGLSDGVTVASRYLAAWAPLSTAVRMKTRESALFSMSRRLPSVPCPLSTPLMVVRRRRMHWLCRVR